MPKSLSDLAPGSDPTGSGPVEPTPAAGPRKRVLITGVSGFVGSHTADYLLEHSDDEIFGLRRMNSSLRNLKHLAHGENGRFRLLIGDLIDRTSLLKVVRDVKPDRIYHFGALSWVTPSWDLPAAYMETNAIGTINLFEALREAGCTPRLLVSCTPEEYGDVPAELIPITEETRLYPVNPYAASKVAQDAVCQTYFASYGFPVIRTRAFNHEGPRRDILGANASFAYQIARIERGLQEPPVRVGNLEATRNFTDVRDTVRAYCLAMEKGVPGELYLIGSQQIYTMEQCLKTLIALSPLRDRITYTVDPERVRPTELNTLIGRFEKFERLTGWRPAIPFEDTMRSILDYWREFVDKNLY
jgi:GDP-4-dehydro-6-deoxy-D-mannose reductase